MNSCISVAAHFLNFGLDHVRCHHGDRGCPFLHAGWPLLCWVSIWAHSCFIFGMESHLFQKWLCPHQLTYDFVGPQGWQQTYLLTLVAAYGLERGDFLFWEYFNVRACVRYSYLHSIRSNPYSTIDTDFCELILTSTSDLQPLLVSVSCILWCNSLAETNFWKS